VPIIKLPEIPDEAIPETIEIFPEEGEKDDVIFIPPLDFSPEPVKKSMSPPDSAPTPENNFKSVPTPLPLAPTEITIDPAVPLDESPVDKVTVPDDPLTAVPDASVTLPLEYELIAL